MADKLISQLGARAAVLTTDLMPLEPNAGPPAEKATIAQLITLLNTIYAPVTGGAYVLKAGDTMTGPLLFSADNTIDIGASGATRPRTGYFGTSLVTALVASPAATALSFASAGTTRANFNTSGHLMFNTDNTNDIGAAAATRPRNLFIAGYIQAPEIFIQVAGSGATGVDLKSPGNGILTMADGGVTMFDRLNFGNATALFPALKRSTIILQARLADDSTYCDFEARLVRTSVAFTVATLPVAGTAGRRSYVTNALAPAFGAAVAGGGAVVTPVFDDGTIWIVG